MTIKIPQVHKMIVDVDEDGNGGVEFDEFLKVWTGTATIWEI
jgi:Ca2+-binding EF-hand superfamily protein